MESVHDSDCDGDSDNEFTYEQRVELLSNLIVEQERLIKIYMKDHDIFEGRKNKIDMLNVKKINLLENIRFLESEHHSLFEKNNSLTQEIKNNKFFSSMNENFILELKCLMKYLTNAKPMVIKEV